MPVELLVLSSPLCVLYSGPTTRYHGSIYIQIFSFLFLSFEEESIVGVCIVVDTIVFSKREIFLF